MRRPLGDEFESVVVSGLCYVALQVTGPLSVSGIIESCPLCITHAVGVDAVPSFVDLEDLTARGHHKRLGMGVHSLRPIASSPQSQSGALIPAHVFLLVR